MYIYQQKAISHQQAQKNQMMKHEVVMENQMSQQNSKIQQKPNEKTLYALKNPQIMQKQVKSIPKVNEFPIVKKEDILYGKAKPLT